MERIEWQIKNQNAKYKVSENLSKESSINISKEIFEFLGAKQSGDIITVILRKNDFLLAFSNLVSNLPLFYYRNGSQKAEFNSEFFESNYNEIKEQFGDNERIEYKIKVRINDESTTRYYLYRMDGTKNFIIRDFLIGEYSVLHFIKNDNGEIIIKPVLNIVKKEDNMFETSPSTQPPQQTIYYGVPGSGKSYKIDEITKNLSEEQKIRVVFHPEYTNADFVGQILPCLTSDGIEYRFKAGPFSKILKKAYQNPDKPHYLIIEEINRGNAAAIFGDLFQLLDRDSKGLSSYEIENLDINSFIRSKDSTYSDAKIESSVNVGDYTWTENTGIRLPPNLSLLATMNTSDQNVFTLDNAFQRRWDMELVPNSCDDPTQMQAKISVKKKTITWESFQSKINEVIAEKGNESGFSSMEDKRLGCWFIKNDEGKIDSEKFANKVLKYLWDDAFKFNRSEIFIDEVKNFEELKNLFIGDKGFEIFKDINFDFEPQNLEENQES